MASQQAEVLPKLEIKVEKFRPKYHLKMEGYQDPYVTVSIDDDGDTKIEPFPGSGDHRPFYLTERETQTFIKMLQRAMKDHAAAA
jgi:coproporphyrinogen III oxidase